jgi:geranylgeranylglycerol-phosphate geranylgeranyltransferase
MMKKLRGLWDLMRLGHGIMLALAIIVGAVIAARELFGPLALDIFFLRFISTYWVKIILTFFTALFLEASTFALNDYYDIEIDRKNKRTDRPLVRGDLAPKTALYIFFLLFPLGILCSYFVNLTCFLIALITALFAIFYDVVLKKIKLLGNFFIAYIMAIPFVFGGAAVLPQGNTLDLNLNPAIFIIALIAFLAGAGREIMKDVMDFEGDRQKGVRSFPRYLGTRKSNMIAAVFYLIAIALSLLPFFFQGYGVYYQNLPYFILVFLTDTLLLSTSLQLIIKKKPDMKFYRNYTLLALFIGLLAFLVGAFMGG